MKYCRLSPVALRFINANTVKQWHYLLKIITHVSWISVFSPRSSSTKITHICAPTTQTAQTLPRSTTVSVLNEFERQTERQSGEEKQHHQIMYSDPSSGRRLFYGGQPIRRAQSRVPTGEAWKYKNSTRENTTSAETAGAAEVSAGVSG